MKCLIFTLCVVVFLLGCQPERRPGETPVQVSGDLSSNDLVQIKQKVAEEWAVRSGPDNRLPIKSIAVTTNSIYEFNKRVLADFKVEAATNRMFDTRVQDMENRIKSLTPRPAVEVWYADSHARWGESGYHLEKETNDWIIAGTLSR